MAQRDTKCVWEGSHGDYETACGGVWETCFSSPNARKPGTDEFKFCPKCGGEIIIPCKD